MRIIAYALLPLIVADAQIHAQSASKNMAIETSIENASKHDLDWVRVAWDGPNFSAGILRVGTFSTDVRFRPADVLIDGFEGVTMWDKKRNIIDPSATAKGVRKVVSSATAGVG